MSDIAAQFREFARLDRARQKQGLSVLEHERWVKLKAQLDQTLARSPGKEPGENRRSVERVATRLNCAYASGGNQCEATVSNLSTGGVFIRTEWPLPIGSELRLSIHLEDTGQDVTVEGLVVSTNVDVTLGSPVHGMGVRFARVAPEVADQLSAVYATEAARSRRGEVAAARVA